MDNADIRPEKSHHTSIEDVHSSVPVKYRSAWRRLFAFIGPAYLVSVGYMDPGNWATDIEGGARFGYTLIWVLFMSNLMAVLLQTLSARLGIITGKDLAQACRAEYDKSVGYFLWVLAEIAIAACDLAEVLGTIIGLNLLFGLPLLWGCVVAGFDTFLLLAIQKFGIRKLEGLILMLITTVGLCMLLEVFFAKPSWGGIVRGFVPHINSSNLYIAIGILGATVMPHNLYLHSALVQSRHVEKGIISKAEACKFNLIDSVVALNAAFLVNAAILIMAAANFFSRGIVVTEIQQAHSLLDTVLGPTIAPAAFAVALVAAGQSSTITGTLAGQVVMEGFLQIKVKPWIRRILTRMMALVPAVVVILVSGGTGSYKLLIWSQVILSLQLPFAIIPLLHFTSDKMKMGAFANRSWVLLCGWTVAVIIIALSGNLVYQQIVSLAGHGGGLAMLTWFLIIPLAVVITLILAWITIVPWVRGRRSWKPQQTVLDKIEIVEPDKDPITHIGVALDNSPVDELVISRAMSLAKIHKAELTLIHVTDSPGVQVYGSQMHDEHARDDINYIYEIAEILKHQGFKARAVLRAGRPAPEIVKAVHEEKINLLLMGSHGHRFIGDMFYGETESNVRHNLDIPIMVVKPTKPSTN
jgi:manganese transport protein